MTSRATGPDPAAHFREVGAVAQGNQGREDTQGPSHRSRGDGLVDNPRAQQKPGRPARARWTRYAGWSFLEPLLEVVAQPLDDRVGLGLDDQLLDHGLDAFGAPLAALAEVGLGPLADDVRRGRRRARLGQADGGIPRAVSGPASPPVMIVRPAMADLTPLVTSRVATWSSPIAPSAIDMSRTSLMAEARVSGMP